MSKHAYADGSCIGANELGGFSVSVWWIEFAYDGLTGPSSMTDPATIQLHISINGDDVRILDPWWNQQ